jgi:hypothetical protein
MKKSCISKDLSSSTTDIYWALNPRLKSLSQQEMMTRVATILYIHTNFKRISWLLV